MTSSHARAQRRSADRSRADPLCRGGDDDGVPAAAPAGRPRLPAGGRRRRAPPAGAAVRRRAADAHDVGAGRRAADVLAGPRVQPAQADQDRADGRHRRRHPVQPDALARLPGGAPVRLDGLRGAVRGRRAGDLQHHDHREGVRRAEGQGPAGRDRVRHPDRRGPDRDPAADDPDRGRDRRRPLRERARAQRRQAGRLPGRLAGRRDADRPAADARRRPPAQQRDDRGRRGRVCRSRSRCWRAG